MKICLINNLYKPFSRGGAERVLELISQGLIELGHEVVIITTRPIFLRFKPNKDEKIYYLPSTYYFWDKIPKFLRPLFHTTNIFNVFTSYKILKILKLNNADLVITNNLIGLNLIFLSKLKKIIPKHIHILHDIQLLHPSGLMFYGNEKIINSKLAKIYQSIIRQFITKADKIISPSSWLLKEHTDRNYFVNSKSEVILNPVKLSLNKNEKKNVNPNIPCKLLFVGLLSRAKGIEVLLDAFENISNSKNFILSLVGENFIGKNLDYHLSKNSHIKYFGILNHEQVIKKMVQSDILIMPSLCYENSPTVIYEAISIGLPVIASDIAGIPELASLGKIKLFKPGDGADLCRVLNNHINIKENTLLKSITALNTPKNYAEKILS